MNDEELWKRRFLGLMLVRLAGLAMMVLGVAIMFTDLIRVGGWPQLGAIITIFGAIDSLFAARILKRSWERG
jgi:hypothetical protein